MLGCIWLILESQQQSTLQCAISFLKQKALIVKKHVEMHVIADQKSNVY